MHPLLEGDHPKIHTLYEPSERGTGLRARATATVWPARLLRKIRMNFPDFDPPLARDDTYRPHGRIGVADPPRNGDEVSV